MAMLEPDFMLLAGILQAARDDTSPECVDTVSRKIAKAYEQAYMNFNVEWFLSACGVNPL